MICTVILIMLGVALILSVFENMERLAKEEKEYAKELEAIRKELGE